MRIYLLLALVLLSAIFFSSCGGGSSSSGRGSVVAPPAEPPAAPPRGSPGDYAITADGKVWLQPVDFTGYSYDQVSTVCSTPGGVCSGSLQGSTFDLTGYRWASIMDVSSLFNAYQVNPPFSEPFQFREDHEASEAMSQDFTETANYCEGDCTLTIVFVAGMVRDQAPDSTQPYVAVAYQNETSGFYNTTPVTEGLETPPHAGFHPPEDVVGVWLWKPVLDTVSVDGREWAQVDLFTNLSWNDIDAVCPEGACAGVLNGHDMTGWTWASVEEIKQLFNYYIGSNALGPTDSWYGGGGWNTEWANAFRNDGWRGFVSTPEPESMVQTQGLLRDRFSAEAAYQARLVDVQFDDAGFFSGDQIFTSETRPIDFKSAGSGGWFYRKP